jgi:hypothetical protein
VYITLNPITPELLARYANRVEEGAQGLTTDRHVLRRRWLPIDFDATRPAKISATDAEHEAALQRAMACRAWLRQQQWPEPLAADSGNGAHLLYRLDLPNDAASTRLITHTLQALALLFSDAHMTVDETTSNAARVWKLYGTLVCKGDHLPQRPHRLARLIAVPDVLEVVPHEHLIALAALLPEPPGTTPRHRVVDREAFDLMQWVVHHQLPVVSQGPWGNGGYKWILNPCPWNPEHTNRAAYLVQLASGAIAAGCHHHGCIGKDWQALRRLYDPARHRLRDHPPGASSGAGSNGARISQGHQSHKVPHVITLSTVQPEPVSWLWEPYIPRRKLTLVEGDPGTGKTWLMLQIAASISQGYGLPGRDGKLQGKQGAGQPVLYLSAEDGLADTLRPRLDAAGADCTNIHALTGWREQEGELVKTGSITLADLRVITAAIATYRPALVIIDPLQAYLGAKTDMYRANEVRPLLAALVLLAEQYDCAMVCVRHLAKASQARAIYRGLGSIDFTAAARSVLLVGEAPPAQEEAAEGNAPAASRRVLAHSKSSLAPHGPSLVFELREGTLYWLGLCPITANELAAGLQHGARRDVEVQKAEAWLRASLRQGPRRANEGGEAAAGQGIALRTLKRAKKALGVHSQKAGGVWYWSMPSTLLALLAPLAMLTLLALLARLPPGRATVSKKAKRANPPVRHTRCRVNNDIKRAKRAKRQSFPPPQPALRLVDPLAPPVEHLPSCIPEQENRKYKATFSPRYPASRLPRRPLLVRGDGGCLSRQPQPAAAARLTLWRGFARSRQAAEDGGGWRLRGLSGQRPRDGRFLGGVWTGRAGWGTVVPQGVPGARALLRPALASAGGERFQTGLHGSKRQMTPLRRAPCRGAHTGVGVVEHA